MPSESAAPQQFKITWLFAALGLFFLVLAITLNEVLFAFFDPNPPLAESTRFAVRTAQLRLFATSLLLAGLNLLARLYTPMARFLSQEGVTNVALACLVLLVPVATIEIAGRPFTQRRTKTTIFVRDASLGWKLKPGAKDSWGGSLVHVNEKGLRGPSVSYARTPGIPRILFLGDSVTFGFMLSFEDSFPHRTELHLEDLTGRAVETVNAGVGGYSAWQQYRFLVSEGIQYRPDLVILTFVLNDIQINNSDGAGRSKGGYQLRNTVQSITDVLAKKSVILYGVLRARARMRFGRNVAEGARLVESETVKLLTQETPPSAVDEAWNKYLEDLEAIVKFCNRRELPLLIVMSPFTFQLSDPSRLGEPQRRLERFAESHSVATLNLLPLLHEELRIVGDEPSRFFLDEDHLSAAGSEVVGRIVAKAIVEKNLLNWKS